MNKFGSHEVNSWLFSCAKIEVKIGGKIMKNPMEGVGTHLDISPKDNEFMIKIRELVDSDPDLLANSDIMKLVKVALFRAGKNEPVHEIAKELDDGLSGYLAKNDFKAPAGVKKLQLELEKYNIV